MLMLTFCVVMAADKAFSVPSIPATASTCHMVVLDVDVDPGSERRWSLHEFYVLEKKAKWKVSSSSSRGWVATHHVSQLSVFLVVVIVVAAADNVCRNF